MLTVYVFQTFLLENFTTFSLKAINSTCLRYDELCLIHKKMFLLQKYVMTLKAATYLYCEILKKDALNLSLTKE